MSYAALFEQVVRPQTSQPADEWTVEQQAALSLPTQASAVITAGAGSGKTKLLVQRACDLVRRGVNPERIALISFTRKSAEQLRDRISLKLGRKNRLPVCSTLHSLALRYCLRDGPVNLVKDDSLGPVLQEVRGLLGDSAEQLSDRDIELLVSRHRELRHFSSSFGIAARHWMERLVEAGMEDFTSLIERGSPRDDERFTHLLIDEAQDLSPVQQQFISRLAAPGAAIWYVGDDDQSIFLFRGAGNATMHALSAQSEHPLALTLNWRCARSIVDAANSVMAPAPGRPQLQWRSARDAEGSVRCVGYATADDEVLAALHFAVQGPGCMVLARTQRQLEPFKAHGLKCATVHEAKGLEWDSVWILGCNEGQFPHALCDAEEERRLFYVAMTRARNDLTMSFSLAASLSSKKKRGISRFLTSTGYAPAC